MTAWVAQRITRDRRDLLASPWCGRAGSCSDGTVVCDELRIEE
jgi:hypothetical protein